MIRGYSNKLIYKYFVKFTNNYSACLKYSVHDVLTLWEMSLDYKFIESIDTSDPDAIKGVVKHCKIIVEDMHPGSKFGAVAIGDPTEPAAADLSHLPVAVDNSEPQ